jgi:N-acetylmuramoyl-L-alanine amidase
VGYDAPDTGVLDKATRNVIAAFQMHYRPQRYDGYPDAETLGILRALP